MSPASKDDAGTSAQETRARLTQLLKEKAADVNFAPLSYGQQRLWFLEQLTPGSPAYNLPAAVLLKGTLDAEALRTAFASLVARHESLRTAFVARDGLPSQLILPPWAPELPLTDLSHLPQAEREPAARRLAAEESARPFDLAAGRPLRARLLRIADDEHVLLLVMHHIVSDGWSMGVLVRELGSLYDAAHSGRPAPLPELPVQYADYAAWQREWMRGGSLDAQLAYWRQRLADAPQALELPTDRPRPPAQSFAGARHRFRLGAELSAGLRVLARREGVTEFMLLLAAWAALLMRYSGQREVVVGTPVAGRTLPETEGLIGFFVNTLALRAELAGEPTFRELLQRVREECLGAFAHQEAPFERVVEELGVERDLSRHPLFQVMLIFQNAPMPALELAGLTLSPFEFDSGMTRFDLVLEVAEEGGQELGAVLQYRTDLFEAATVERLARHWMMLLGAAVEDPEQGVWELPLLTTQERRQVVEQWNETAAEFEDGARVHELYEAQAARTPDALAVVCAGQGLSFRELDERANQLARYLRRSGVGPETRVGLLTERSVEMLVGLFGILKAGGAYVPLDPDYPEERLRLLLEDARAPFVLTQQHLLERLPAGTASAVCLDSDWPAIAVESRERVESGATARNLAYVIYTSGSTGLPKGVLIEHRSVVNLAGALRRTVYASHEGRALRVGLNAPISFDASVKQWLMLLHGHTLHVLTEEVRRDAQLFVRYVGDHALDAFDCTPSQLAALFEAGLLDTSSHGPRMVLVGGEALDASMWETLGRNGKIEFYNVYGPTECTVDATACRVEPATPKPSIGRPLSNVRTYVLDSAMRPVAQGVVGELYVGGAGLARGYLNRPALTAHAFVPDPFSHTPGARLYRTGDLVRLGVEGALEFVGRRDQQVKLRGHRIELSEIEAVLRSHPAVRDCAVLVRVLNAAGPVLAAYFVTADADAGKDVERDVRAYVSQRLPEYMRPAAYVELEALPLTPHGKLDRARLPVPVTPEVGVQAGPRTEVERVVARAWAEVLGREAVGREEGFFEAGGHSLLAARLAARLRARCGAAVSVRDVFEYPTVASMAEHIRAALAGGEAARLPPVEPVPRDGNLPLSFAQQRLWFLSQLTPESPYYNLTAAIRIRGALEVAPLERALAEIVRRHESLRTNFGVSEGQPVQRIRPEGVMSLAALDLRDLAAEVREGEASRLISEDARKPFDLERDMLLRTRLLRVADDEHVLVLVMHHIVSDGWSTNIFAKELAELYAAYRAGQPSTLAELPVQYADYAAWQREWMRGGSLDAQLAYWRQRLADAPQALELPTDRPRPPAQSFAGARHRFRLGAELSAGLRVLARREGVTEFMLLLAAWAALLMRYSGQREVVVGTPVAGRTLPETEGLIGFFVNTLALRVEAGDGETFKALLQRVREECLGAYAHQEAPFERVVEELGVARDLSRHPIFQVVLAVENAPDAPLQLPGLDLSPLEAETQTAKFDLTLFVRETPEGEFAAELEYDTALFAPETAGRMARHLLTLLREAVADPRRRLSELSLLTAEEREQVRRWNETDADFPSERMVHELFEEQAARTPETVAVVAGPQSITYRELNERANRLARHLRGLGVGAESVVALALERSIEMIVAILGSIKAGAAYLPLDPEYPPERLAFMLEDSGAAVMLTQEHLLPVLPTRAARRIICLDRDWPAVARESDADPPNLTRGENIVYIIYTSGSTGVPKGVMVKQRSLVNLCYALREFFDAEEVRRTALITSFSFDISVNQVFPTLLFGRTLHIIRNEVKYDSRALMQYAAAAEIDLMDCVPSYLNSVLTMLGGEQLGRHFKYLLIGGEKVERSLLRKVFTQLGEQVRVVNIYGLTELTDINALSCIESREAEAVVTVGRPVANTQIYITNAGGELQPVGVTGELCIGGVGVSRGYRNRPAMTAEKFSVNPYGAGEVMCRTGDVGRWLADGRIEVLGRIDHQVKVRGFRIELGEIEAALAQHEGIAETVVVARETESGDRRLAAYVVGRGGPAPTAERLRAHLQGRLPEYMIPSYFVALPALPRTPNGKLDRRALPAPTEATAANDAAFVPPRTPLEEVLSEIWAGVLGVERVGIEDNFFALGGHSLLAIQLLSEIRDTLQFTLPMRAIFEHSTVATLSAYMLQDPDLRQGLEKRAELLVKLSLISDDEAEVMLRDKASSDKEVDAP